MITGSQFDRTYRSGDKFTGADLEEQQMQFLYHDGKRYHFMNTSSYDQLELTEEQVGDAVNYLTENQMTDMLLFQGRPIGVSLPNFVNLKVARRIRAQRRHGIRRHQTDHPGNRVCPSGAPLHRRRRNPED